MDGRASIYRRDAGGNFDVELWVPSAQRQIKRSLKTPSEETARLWAMEFVPEKLATEKAGLSVFSETPADMINAWESKQRARLERGEIRSEARVVRKVNLWTKELTEVYGPVDQVLLSSMFQD